MTYRITSEFGAIQPSVRDGVHTGIDLAMPIGTTLRSTIDGVITKVYAGDGTIGKGVMIKGKNGKEYIFGHMDKVDVQIGQQIYFGETIGTSGNTGNSTGPHLHYAIRDENGKYIDPEPYIETLQKVTGNNSYFANNNEFTGDTFYKGPSNSRSELDGRLECEKFNENADLFDVNARFQSYLDYNTCIAKVEISDKIENFFKALIDVACELSTGVALIGGWLLIMLNMFGMQRAFRYFGILQGVNLLIHILLGGKSYESY